MRKQGNALVEGLEVTAIDFEDLELDDFAKIALLCLNQKREGALLTVETHINRIKVIASQNIDAKAFAQFALAHVDDRGTFSLHREKAVKITDVEAPLDLEYFEDDNVFYIE